MTLEYLILLLRCILVERSDDYEVLMYVVDILG
jgi:hypothetical protein